MDCCLTFHRRTNGLGFNRPMHHPLLDHDQLEVGRLWYHKTEGDSFHASFRLQCPSGWSTDQGFTASKGHEYSYVFKIGNKGACYGWLYNLGSGAQYRVGPVNF